MSRKRKTYTVDFKAKLVLEVLESEKTLNEIASKYEVLPKSLQDWKKQFLDNARLAFDKSAVVKEYKDQIEDMQKQSDALAKKLGNVIIERDWAAGKQNTSQKAKALSGTLCASLDLSNKKDLFEKSHVLVFQIKCVSFGLVLTEAFSYGLSVLSTDECFMPYILDDKSEIVLKDLNNLEKNV